MHGDNRGWRRPPAINSVAGKKETAANIQQGKQRTITQMFFNPPQGSPGVKIVSSPPKKKSPLQLSRSSSFPQKRAAPNEKEKAKKKQK